MDAVQLWRESLPEESRVEVTAAVALVSVGVLAGVSSIVRRKRGFFAWAVPGALIAAGVVLLADLMLDTRSERILETQVEIEAQLASLDPIARAQVLKNVGQSQLRAVLPNRG
jgi:hypothetical protein